MGPDVSNLCELYDPLAGNWTKTSNMHFPRCTHTASVLPDGKVLVVGGNDDPEKACELYDPLTEKWTVTGRTHIERLLHTASVLFDGKMLVTGGSDGATISFNSTELYDPLTRN